VLGTLAWVGWNRPISPAKLLMAVLISPMVVPVVVVGSVSTCFRADRSGRHLYRPDPGARGAGAPFVVTTGVGQVAGFPPQLVRDSMSLGAGPLRTFFASRCR